jgi:CRISPR-associated protein Cas6/Cse3/CasE subtype I-E
MFITEVMVPYWLGREARIEPVEKNGKADPQAWHDFVIEGVNPQDRNGDGGRYLFRVDKMQEGKDYDNRHELGTSSHVGAKIIAQTQFAPNWDIPRWKGRLKELVKTAEFEPKFSDGQMWRFVARINACTNVVDAAGKQKRRGVTSGEQPIWFRERAEASGFSVEPDALDAYDEGMLKSPSNVQLKSALFKGVLRILDRAKFEETYRFGMCRAKGYGFGMLSLLKA